MLYLPFDNDFRDYSDETLPVKVEGVKLVGNVSSEVRGGGAAFFDGNSRIVVWRFSNIDIGKKFTIRFNYRETGPMVATPKPEALVTNANCKGECSLAVSFNRTSMKTTARISTDVQGDVYLDSMHVSTELDCSQVLKVLQTC